MELATGIGFPDTSQPILQFLPTLTDMSFSSSSNSGARGSPRLKHELTDKNRVNNLFCKFLVGSFFLRKQFQEINGQQANEAFQELTISHYIVKKLSDGFKSQSRVSIASYCQSIVSESIISKTFYKSLSRGSTELFTEYFLNSYAIKKGKCTQMRSGKKLLYSLLFLNESVVRPRGSSRLESHPASRHV